MDVEVMCLRAKGRKLTKEELRLRRPVRGDLTVTSRLGHREREFVIVASLTSGPRFDLALPVLDHMRLTRLRGDSFVLFGFEEVKTGHKNYTSFPQAWWCRPAKDHVPTAEELEDEPDPDPGVMLDLYEEQM